MENEYFRTTKDEDGNKVYIIKDSNEFYDIDITGSVLGVNKYGFVENVFTKESIEKMEHYCKEVDTTKNIYDLKMELRNRTLNTLIGMIF